MNIANNSKNVKIKFGIIHLNGILGLNEYHMFLFVVILLLLLLLFGYVFFINADLWIIYTVNNDYIIGSYVVTLHVLTSVVYWKQWATTFSQNHDMMMSSACCFRLRLNTFLSSEIIHWVCVNNSIEQVTHHQNKTKYFIRLQSTATTHK